MPGNPPLSQMEVFDSPAGIRIEPVYGGWKKMRDEADAPADIQPLRDVDVKELDQTLFKETYLPAAVSPDVLAENTRTTEEQMASLRLVDLGPPLGSDRVGCSDLGKETLVALGWGVCHFSAPCR